MQNIFLGKPSSTILTFMTQRMHTQKHEQSIELPMIWKDACNPDGTPLSNIESAVWLGSTGQTFVSLSNSNGAILVQLTTAGNETVSKYAKGFLSDGTSTIYYKDAISAVVRLELYEGTSFYTKYDCVFFRKYTPGHWEDADGNWVEGSFGDWTVTYTNDSKFSNYRYDQPQLDGDIYLVSLYYGTNPTPINVRFSQIDSSVNAIQNSLLIYRSYSGSVYFATRTWTNTRVEQ